MSSNLLTVVGEKTREPQEHTPIVTPVASRHTRITVTCSSGMQVIIDQVAHSFEQTAWPRTMADIMVVTPLPKGQYWMLHPNPPIDGEDMKITAPRADGHRRVIELFKVQIEPADESAAASSD